MPHFLFALLMTIYWSSLAGQVRLANDLDGHDDDDCFEGGPMTREEAEAFEALPAFSAILAMRDWDDKAKVRPSSSPSSIIVSMRDIK